MAKINNKGFSLIEVVIAIALFSLLLSPIIRQFTQTLQTNRQAKEQQYINDNAEELVEYFQKVDLNRVGADDLGVVSLSGGVRDKKEVECSLYDETGAVIGIVEYNLSVYNPESVELGTKRTEYNRKVYVDDLPYKIAAFDTNPGDAVEEGYKIKYDCTSSMALSFTDFQLNRDGSMVKYNSLGEVIGVVCYKVDYSNVDPNTLNLGNMQNLDYSTVALIQGNATNFDKQADDAFYSLKMKNLKEYNYTSWDQAMNQVDGWNLFENVSLSSTSNKLTLLKVIDNGDDTYTVTCDVFYEDNYHMPRDAEHGGGTINLSDKLTYNVFSQTFDIGTCPDIYFIYQPYTVYRSGETVNYSADDYILVDNQVPDCKLYLVKPNRDEREASTILDLDEKDYLSTPTINSNIVKINMNYSATSEKLDVYTNLDVVDMETSGNKQFSLGIYDKVTSAGYIAQRFAYDKDHIHAMSDDKREGDIIYRITVEYVKSDGTGSTTKLIGSKGGN